MTTTLLLVDADEAVRRGLADQLQLDGIYTVLTAPDIAAAQSVAGTEKIALVLVALSGDDQAARTALAHWHRVWPGMPIIALLPGQGRPVEGAKATLVKPLRIAQLLDTIAGMLESPEPPGIVIGRHIFEPRAKRLVDRTTPALAPIRLTEKEAALLDCLLNMAGDQIVPRETLLAVVWGYNPAATTHTLETHIYRLRRKLGEPSLLVAEAGGYRVIR